jgi:23S rRNA pseudouridine2605 synthase
MRIAKLIAASGLCSRREAERWIEEGRVTLDGVKLTTPAVVVSEGQEVRVDGKPLKAQQVTKLWKFHKPRGVITSKRDELGRPTIYSLLPNNMQNLLYIGRLDYNSEGLLLLTNDGTLKREWELPSTGLKRTYRVRLLGMPSDVTLNKIRKGVEIDGVRYRGMQVEAEDSKGRNFWLNVTLTEGKNREIRRVFEHFGHSVSRLIRTEYGGYALGSLAAGKVEELALRAP